jgi:hypothetical protein
MGRRESFPRLHVGTALPIVLRPQASGDYGEIPSDRWLLSL